MNNLFQINDSYGESLGIISTDVDEEIIQRALKEYIDGIETENIKNWDKYSGDENDEE